MKGWFKGYVFDNPEEENQKTKQESQRSVNTGGPTEQTNAWIMNRFMRKE